MITVYGRPGCHSCRATRRILARQGTPFQYIDLAENPEHMPVIRELGYASLPVVTITNDAGEIVEHWSDFRADRIKLLAVVEA